MNKKVIDIEKYTSRWKVLENINIKKEEATNLMKQSKEFGNKPTANFWRGVLVKWDMCIEDLAKIWEIEDKE